ncbi:hypothetical protein [Brevibacterium sp. CFH 10365]|uniref:hypothetical protein n=1 Tax=Brevibacterium sp. CFH 10365 TaxID=2585207 RepID=UPI001266312B|nr:hypothetical protein [Brevibacterium sp. CFH 10365]
MNRGYSNDDYRRGWDAERRGSETALERADARGEPTAWYDGYMDSATGRPKYFLANHPDWDESRDGDWVTYLDRLDTRKRVDELLQELVKDTLEWAQFDMLARDEPVPTHAAVDEMVKYVPEMVADDAGDILDRLMRVIGED